jgi:hypothetical protein
VSTTDPCKNAGFLCVFVGVQAVCDSRLYLILISGKQLEEGIHSACFSIEDANIAVLPINIILRLKGVGEFGYHVANVLSRNDPARPL